MKRIVLASLLCLAPFFAAAPAAARPLVAVLAQNDGTEITDFLVLYGVLASSGAADVVAVSTEAGPVTLMPGPRIRVDTTLDAFDRAHPEGAAFVVVPAFHDSRNPVTRTWLRAQAAKGATLVSICDGALAVAETGLLDGHRATAHFYSASRRRREFPNVDWVANARFVDDGGFVSSSGVSASLPTALHLVERIAGRARALEVARAYGLEAYGPEHDSDAFHIGAPEYWLAAKGYLFAWPRDVYAVALVPGMDEVALAFAIDMLSLTYRSEVLATAAAAEVPTRHGLRVLRDAAPEALPARAVPVYVGGGAPARGVAVGEGARAPEDVLAYLAKRYGEPTAAFVAQQLEYPRAASR